MQVCLEERTETLCSYNISFSDKYTIVEHVKPSVHSGKYLMKNYCKSKRNVQQLGLCTFKRSCEITLRALSINNSASFSAFDYSCS